MRVDMKRYCWENLQHHWNSFGEKREYKVPRTARKR